jgi:hypothetical protein
MDLLSTLSPNTGLVRVRLQSPDGRWLTVGPLLTLSGARRLTEDLLAGHHRIVSAVRVEHRQGSTWRPAWTFSQGSAQ